MTGLAIIATGLMAGYGPWRGKQVESRNNVVDEFSQSYNYNNQTMGFESPIPLFLIKKGCTPTTAPLLHQIGGNL